jgi:hypothetical protein
LLVALPAQAQNSEPTSSIERNPAWATPVLDVPEVERLFLVEPNFYRSAQPTPEGFKALVARKGLRAVVNPRATHSDASLTQGLGLRLFDFGMPAWHIEREDVVGALRTLRTETRMGPTLLHCTLGADRTGLVAALYRITSAQDVCAVRLLPGLTLSRPASDSLARDNVRSPLPSAEGCLGEAGYVEGQNIAIEYRRASNDDRTLPGLIDELVRRQVAVIATMGNPTLRAAAAANAQ